MTGDDAGDAWIAWHPERPERVNDPAIRRSLADRALIAVIKTVTRRRSYEVFRVVAIRRGLLRPFLSYNARMMPFGRLGRRRTELAILRVAAFCRSEYEWTQHVPIARRAGVKAVEIDAVVAGAWDGLPPADAVMLRAVDELLVDRTIADATFAELSKTLKPALILELCLLTGHYAGLAGALNAFGTPLEPALRRPGGLPKPSR